MSTHQFALGEIVCFRRSSPVKVPDSFEILALLPERDGSAQYTIRSEYEAFDRVVPEEDIELVSGRAANSNIPARARGG